MRHHSLPKNRTLPGEVIMPTETLLNRLETSVAATSINAPLHYLAPGNESPQIRIYPPNSGLSSVRPPSQPQTVSIRDAREVAGDLMLDECGFALHTRPSRFSDFYDETAVRKHYYPEVESTMRSFTGARAVIAFDHNVRSAARAARGEVGVRLPAEQVHNDYTARSGPLRRMEILKSAERLDLADRHFAFINLWRPIIGPVLDNPLAVCDARSVQQSDFVVTQIRHFGEGDLKTPRHIGEIYSVAYRPEHKWFYVSRMQPTEILLLKCFDSHTDGRARFMPHTGFKNPACPSEYVPRESIEVRTLAVFDEAIG
jgi:hypothetical protein